jgi:hypothetical protein
VSCHQGRVHGEDGGLVQAVGQVQSRLHRGDVADDLGRVALFRAAEFGEGDRLGSAIVGTTAAR